MWKRTELAKQLIGVVPQFNTLDRALSVRDNLPHHGRYFGCRRRRPARSADDLLETIPTRGSRTASALALSGGMAQRRWWRDRSCTEPAVLFLDEPTTGSTRRAPLRCGTSARAAVGPARRSCSPRTTWKRRTSCATDRDHRSRQGAGARHAGRLEGPHEDGHDRGRVRRAGGDTERLTAWCVRSRGSTPERCWLRRRRTTPSSCGSASRVGRAWFGRSSTRPRTPASRILGPVGVGAIARDRVHRAHRPGPARMTHRPRQITDRPD